MLYNIDHASSPVEIEAENLVDALRILKNAGCVNDGHGGFFEWDDFTLVLEDGRALPETEVDEARKLVR